MRLAYLWCCLPVEEQKETIQTKQKKKKKIKAKMYGHHSTIGEFEKRVNFIQSLQI